MKLMASLAPARAEIEAGVVAMADQHLNTNYCHAKLHFTMAIELSSIITVTVLSANRMYSKTFVGKLVILVSLNLNEIKWKTTSIF